MFRFNRMWPAWREPLELLLLFSVLLLVSCATQTPTAATRPAVCVVWRTVTFDRLKDTLETISEVKAQNAARAAYCGA